METAIDSYIEEHSGFETRRNYLSMSHLSDCPRQIVREYRNGFAVSEHTHRMAYAGYEMETAIKSLLMALGAIEYDSLEVIADFDQRLIGHVDGLTQNGTVIEIKSVSKTQFAKLLEKGRALYKHFCQVQLYMHYGKVKEALIVYRCRDTYEHKVFQVPYNKKVADELQEKAQMILRHIDAGTLPECTCGECALVEARQA